MAFEQTLTTEAKYAALGVLMTGTVKMALYTANANLGPATLVYAPANEVTGAGYVAGGKVLTGVTISKSGTTAFVDFDDVVWDPASFTARGALIYNESLGGLAIAVLDFGADKTAQNTFRVQMPANAADSALVRIA